MLTFAIIAGLILLVVLLLLLFRINALTDVMKTTGQRRASSSNKVNAVLMMVFLIGASALFFCYFNCQAQRIQTSGSFRSWN